MLTLRPALSPSGLAQAPPPDAVEDLVGRLLAGGAAMSPSRPYVALLRHRLANRWDLSQLDLRGVTAQLQAADCAVDRRSAQVVPAPQ